MIVNHEEAFVTAWKTCEENNLANSYIKIFRLLKDSLPYVEATAGASHLTDGFNRQPENEHDILVKKIKECLD